MEYRGYKLIQHFKYCILGKLSLCRLFTIKMKDEKISCLIYSFVLH